MIAFSALPLTTMISRVSLQSLKNLCLSQEACSSWCLVSISSSRSSQRSFNRSFHSAMVAESEWCRAIRLSQVWLAAATRSVPMDSVSSANSWNLSFSNCNNKRIGVKSTQIRFPF
ncbi:hypothetical protein DPMN_099606 [Dreissena polymorpha]|uniref:Uncharacterized protein n=1 Tax=Dreissena polymorpha TaxID=45954 RepID=A0A9D4R6P7_DREPO|nr:hypothetical protein DPMN_099606 [Dreissena polymorpha]